VADAHKRLIDATAAGFASARPGAVISDIFHAMQAVADPEGDAGDAGRIGHGLGLQLTEWPSIIAADHTELVPGMVLTLEPSVALGQGRLMTHEENIVIRDGGAEYLTRPDSTEIRVISCG
jgi:Xaa-Pro aminopeptidase